MQSANEVLGRVVEMHDSVFGYDKTVKLVVYTLGLVNGCFPEGAAPQSKLAGISPPVVGRDRPTRTVLDRIQQPDFDVFNHTVTRLETS